LCSSSLAFKLICRLYQASLQVVANNSINQSGAACGLSWMAFVQEICNDKRGGAFAGIHCTINKQFFQSIASNSCASWSVP
jgi:hypothetical protein